MEKIVTFPYAIKGHEINIVSFNVTIHYHYKCIVNLFGTKHYQTLLEYYTCKRLLISKLNSDL